MYIVNLDQESAGPNQNKYMPVSYTHLDVYKRQSSPKTIGLEYSTNQGCMQNII